MSNRTLLTASQVINEVDHIQSCFEAISELLIPEQDLHIVGRNNLASLLGYLFEKLHKTDDCDEIGAIHRCLFAITCICYSRELLLV